MALRQRIGLMVPSVNTCSSRTSTASSQHRLRSTRTGSGRRRAQWAAPGSAARRRKVPRRFREMNEDVDVAVRYLMTAPVDILVYGCTSGSFLWGTAERTLCWRIEELSGRPGGGHDRALLSAIRAFGARKITVLTPYPAATNRKLQEFLTASGEIEVLALSAIRRRRPAVMRSPRRTRRTSCDSLRKSCAQAPTSCCAHAGLALLRGRGELEKRLGIPVVTSNQAPSGPRCPGSVPPPDQRHGSLFSRAIEAERIPAGA